LTIHEHINLIFDTFFELKGDRKSGDDSMVTGGLARLKGQKVIIIGYQEDTLLESAKFPGSDGYRKSIRLMNLAETFKKPVVVFIDIPKIKHLPSQQKADEYMVQALESMLNLSVPVVSAIIGTYNDSLVFDLCASDRVLMLEQATCEILLPEKTCDIESTGILHLKAQDLLELHIVDRTIKCSLNLNPKPLGNAWKKAILDEIHQLSQISLETLIEQRLNSLQTRLFGLKSLKNNNV
jgi:acetyl-CoA carboxylase carboxyl transferase subunit alpha